MLLTSDFSLGRTGSCTMVSRVETLDRLSRWVPASAFTEPAFVVGLLHEIQSLLGVGDPAAHASLSSASLCSNQPCRRGQTV